MSKQTVVQRIVYGALAIAALLALFWIDMAVSQHSGSGPLGRLLRHGSAIPLATTAIFLLGAVELNHLLRGKSAQPYARLAYLTIALLLLAPWLTTIVGAAHEGNGEAPWNATVFLLALTAVGLGSASLIGGPPQGSLRDLGATLVMVVFVGFLGSFAVQLRCHATASPLTGAWLLLFVVLVTKASDIGAFFVGSAWGRHRLMPQVSPAKTIEGTVGGCLASTLVAGLIVWIAAKLPSPAPLLPASSPGKAEALGLHAALGALRQALSSGGTSPMYRAFALGLVLSLASQLGDLVESCFKRDAEVKDSGHLIPHFGGILDLIDSLLFAVPAGWFMFTVVWPVG